MNPFFDINPDENLPDEELPLRNLGAQLSMIAVGHKGSSYWGTRGTASKVIYRDSTAEDYDKQFVNKLQKWKPVYDIDRLLKHHYNYYIIKNEQNHIEFLKHMRYVILPALKKKSNSEITVELFEQWLDQKESKDKTELLRALR